jgi:hypothetical protein
VTPIERAREALEAAGCKSRNGRDWTCPAHEDANPSLSLSEGRRGQALVRCHAGCEYDAILAALGLTRADMWPSGRGDDDWTPAGPAVATYRYVDKAGKLVMGVCRTADKQFRQWRPDPTNPDKKLWSVAGIQLVPYRLPEVLTAVEQGRPVFVVEGEKDADAIMRAGGDATCNPMGAGKWRDAYSKWFAGADVLVVADRDEPGKLHAAQVAHSLRRVAANVRIVEPTEGKDAYDHLAAGRTLDELVPPRWVEHESFATGIVEGSASLGDGPPVLPVALEAGADLLADVDQFLRRYVYFSTPAQPTTGALFVAHTWAFAAAEVTPYLHVNSAEKRCGKSLLLDLLRLLCRGPLMAADTTAAALFRSIGDPPPTILFDEVQELFERSVDDTQRELRAVLNAGYRLGGNVRRCVGEGGAVTVADFPVFCPKVLAGTGTLPDMLADRSVPIRLKRKPRDAKVERFRRRDAEAAAAALTARLAGWAKTALPTLTAARPDLPDELHDRQQDIWEPLLAIADAAGGDWPARARDAAVELHGATRPEDSAAVLLLGHIRERFYLSDELDDEGKRIPRPEPLERVTTAALLRSLVDRDDGPWADWWGNDVEADKLKGPAVKLARLLKPFDVAPKQLRFGEANERGYERAAFAKAWALYCPEDDTDASAQVRGGFRHATGSEAVATEKDDMCRDPLRLRHG